MSEVLRVNSVRVKTNIKVLGSGETYEHVDEAEVLRNRLQEQYNNGYKDGQQKIKIDLEKDYADKLYKKYEEVYHILEDYNQRMEEYETVFEKIVINTAYELAKKIVQKEIEKETIVNENIKAAIAKIIGANEVRIKINPADVEHINDYSKGLLNASSFNKIKFEPDERIQPGGCLIETDIGNVDARINSQLEELRLKLEEIIDKSK